MNERTYDHEVSLVLPQTHTFHSHQHHKDHARWWTSIALWSYASNPESFKLKVKDWARVKRFEIQGSYSWWKVRGNLWCLDSQSSQQLKLLSLWFIGSSSELYSSSLVLWSNSILCSRLKYLCVVQVDRLFLGFQKVHHQMCSLHSIASHREWSLHHIFKSQGHSLCSVHRVQWGIVPIRWCLHLSLWFHVRSVLWFSDLIYD